MEFRGLIATLAAPHQVNPQSDIDATVGPRYCGDRRWVWPLIGLPEAAVATLLAQPRPAEMSALANRQGHLEYQLTTAAHLAMADDVLQRTNPWSEQDYPPTTSPQRVPVELSDSLAQWRVAVHRQAVAAIRAQLPVDLQPLAAGSVPETSPRFTVTGLAHGVDACDSTASRTAARQAAMVHGEPGRSATRQVADAPTAPLVEAVGESELRFAMLATPPTKAVHLVAADLVSRRPASNQLVAAWLTMARARRLLQGLAAPAPDVLRPSNDTATSTQSTSPAVDVTDVVSTLAVCPSVLVRSAIAGRPDLVLRHLVAVVGAAEQCFGPMGWDAHLTRWLADPVAVATVQAVHRALKSGLSMVQVPCPPVV